MNQPKFIKEFHDVGPCIIDVALLEKAWDHRFWLSQWQDEFRLIQYTRRGSGNTRVKCTISFEQAQEIIDKLQLVRTQATMASAGSWRKAHQSELDMRSKRQTQQYNRNYSLTENA